MMFMTPIPPTSREITAMPASITVIVLSTDVAALRIDCCVAIEKSALVAVVMPCRFSNSALDSWYAAESEPDSVALT